MSLDKGFNKGIVIIGAGNVATHLSLALAQAGYQIKCIYSKTIHAARSLATKVGSHYTNEIGQIPVEADLYIIAVRDDVVEKIVENLNLQNGIVVHTAGSIPVNVFKHKFTNYGVFYPLQTFSKTRNVDFSDVPICIEANSDLLEAKLLNLALNISKTAQVINSEKRKLLHLAAVFACNFTNHMYAIAENILKQNGLTYDLLKPLITETAKKAIAQSPLKAQTGPAVRNDENVIHNHLEMLKENDDFEKIYRFVSNSIYELQKNE